MHDPHARDDPMFECLDCGTRFPEDVEGRLCSECGGYLRNIGVSRAE